MILPSCMQTCAEVELSISLIGFTSNETDTIIVRKFSKSTGFSTIIDTFLLNEKNSGYQLQNDTLKIIAAYGTDNGLLSRYDYEIYLPEGNKLYQVSEIMEDYRSESTSGCTKEYCINSITSYKINGKLIPAEEYIYTLFISK
jgi:bisphosphoglycerate-dependent phosphoglycerate mutase